MIGDSILYLLYVGVLLYIVHQAYRIMAGEKVEYGMQQAAKMQGAELERTEEVKEGREIAEKERKVAQREKISIEDVRKIVVSVKESAMKEQEILRQLQSDAVNGVHKSGVLAEQMSAKRILDIIALCNTENEQLGRVYQILLDDENWSRRVMATSNNMLKKITKLTRKVDQLERNALGEHQLSELELQDEKLKDHWTTLDTRRMQEVVGDEQKMTRDIRKARNLCHHVRDDLNKDIINYCTEMRMRAENLQLRRKWMDIMERIIQKRDVISEIISSLNMIADEDRQVEGELDAEIAAAKKDEDVKV